jgi:hypothetical protein
METVPASLFCPSFLIVVYSHGKPAEQRRLIRKNDEKLFERSEFFSVPE